LEQTPHPRIVSQWSEGRERRDLRQERLALVDRPTQQLEGVVCIAQPGVDHGAVVACRALQRVEPGEQLSRAAGSAGLELTITGAAYGEETRVQWNGSPRPTTYVSATNCVPRPLPMTRRSVWRRSRS